MAGHIKILAGYLENTEYSLIARRNKLHCKKGFCRESLSLTDFAELEIATEENVKKLGGTLGGALVGGLFLGGIGAFAGASVGGVGKESTAIVTFRNGKRSLVKVNAPMLEAIQVHLFKLSENPNYADLSGKKKMALWKKIVIAILLLAVLGALLKEKQDKPTAPAASGAVQEKSR